MQIISYPAHYQSVYTNFDFSSFSRISCTVNKAFLYNESATFIRYVSLNERVKHACSFAKHACSFATEACLLGETCLFVG